MNSTHGKWLSYSQYKRDHCLRLLCFWASTTMEQVSAKEPLLWKYNHLHDKLKQFFSISTFSLILPDNKKSTELTKTKVFLFVETFPI